MKRRITAARAVLWLGDANSEAGNFTEAVELYRQFIRSAEEIYHDAPSDKDAETILGLAHDRIGRGFLLRGQELARTDFPPDKVSELYRESYSHLKRTLELFKRVADENPDNQKCQRNFVVAQSNMGMALRNVGEFDRSLEILQKVTIEREKNITLDSGNRQLKADYAENLHQLALTLNAKNQHAKAYEMLKTAIEIMAKLIAEDADNMEFRRIQLDVINDYGDLLLKNNDVNSALKFYQSALIQTAADKRPSEQTFTFFAEGLLNKNIGDCYRVTASNLFISTIERKKNLENSRIYYQNALNFWQMSEVQREFLSRTPELSDYLNRELINLDRAK